MPIRLLRAAGGLLSDPGALIVATAALLCAWCASAVVPRWLVAPRITPLVAASVLYDIGNTVEWSRDQEHLAFIAQRRLPLTAAADSIGGQALDLTAIISGEGVIETRTERPLPQSVVVDGVPGPVYQEINGLRWSPDGTHLAYAARIASGRWSMVVDGIPQPPYDVIEGAAFTADCLHLSYRAREGGQGVFVVDGQVVARGDLRAGAVAPRGGRSAWIGADDQGELALHVDGRRVEACTPVPGTPLRFTPDGTGWACVVAVAGGQALCRDGRAGARFESIRLDSLVASPDGSRWAFYAMRDGHWQVVAGDAGYGPYDDVAGEPAWSPDGRQVAFSARSGDRWSGLVDGRPLASEANIVRVVFTPGGAAAWIGHAGTDEVLVMPDGRRWQVAQVADLAFSPDGRHAVTVSRIDHDSRQYLFTGGSHHTLWIDGKPRRTWDRIGPLAFDGNGTAVVFWAVAGGEIARVEMRL